MAMETVATATNTGGECTGTNPFAAAKSASAQKQQAAARVDSTETVKADSYAVRLKKSLIYLLNVHMIGQMLRAVAIIPVAF